MYGVHLQNHSPGRHAWYYMAVRFNTEKEWVVTAAWGKIGYALAPANHKHQSTKEDGTKFANADEALGFLLGVIEKRIKHGYFIVYATPKLLGKLMSELPGTDNPYQGAVTDWMSMYKRGHNVVVDHAPQWFKEVVTAKIAPAAAEPEPKGKSVAEEVKKIKKDAPKPVKTISGTRKIDTLMAKAKAKTAEDDPEEMIEEEEESKVPKGKCSACEGTGFNKRGDKTKRCSLCNGKGVMEVLDVHHRPKKIKQESRDERKPKPAPGSIRRLFNLKA